MSRYELYHHGRMGQKWGEKNGPPYPLALTDSQYKREQAKNESDGGSKSKKSEKKAKSGSNEKKNSGNTRWGVRRYQNEDGTLTELGEKRYQRVLADNNRKKKENRIKEEYLKDPEEWVRDDIRTIQEAVRGGITVSNAARDLADRTKIFDKPQRRDFSGISDDELRRRINRINMERQYSELTAQPSTLSRGRETFDRVMEITGSVLGVTAAGLGIALSINKLRAG